MKTLIIYAHPHSPYSHNKVILDEVLAQFKSRRRKFELLDLYAMKYDPVLSAKEIYTVPNSKPSRQTKQIQKKIGEAHSLIFIYPVWWNSMPAMMKGFIDKTFTSGFAFKYDHHGIPHQLLKGKRAAVFLTTSSPWYVHYFIQGGRAGTIMAWDILWFSGIKPRIFYLDNCKRLSDEKLPKIKKLVEKGLNYVVRD